MTIGSKFFSKQNIIFLVVFGILFSFLFVGLDYKGRDADTLLYNKFVEQLAEKPIKEFLVLEWKELSLFFSKAEPTPFVRDHYPGQFFFPVLVAKLGFPASHILYLFNVFYMLIYLYLFYLIFREFLSMEDASFILYAGMFTILSFNYVLRADHERLVLVFSLLGVLSGLRFREDKRWFWGLFVANGGAFFIKGLATFYVPVFGVISYLVVSGFRVKDLILVCLSGVSIPLVGGLYEIYFRWVTGLPFFEGYWNLQMGARTLEQAPFSIISKLRNFAYYSSRGLVYSLPWSLFAIIIWGRKLLKREVDWGVGSSVQKLYLLLGSLSLFALVCFSFFNRTASRYVFVGNFIIGALCIIYVYLNSKWLKRLNGRVLGHGVFRVMILTWGSIVTLAIGLWYLKAHLL